MQGDTLIDVRNLAMCFPVTQGAILQRKVAEIKAVDGVSFRIRKGETLGLVGESGCGKTTVGRCIIQLHRPTSGQVFFEGTDICRLKGRSLRLMRRRMQMVFQDAYESVDPRMTASDIIGEPIRVHNLARGKELRKQVDGLMEMVGLNPYMANHYPHELSSGERQRIGVARAVAVRPSFVVCDEPVSQLDVSIQAQIISLLEELQAEFALTYLFIAHDLSVVRHISDRVAVMFLGKIVEIASRVEVYEKPLHPYTRALLSAAPVPDPAIEAKRERIILIGDVPSLLNPPPGCNFHSRCPVPLARCRETVPELRNVGGEHWVACHLV